MYRILVVDEDEHLLWALEKNLFPERDDLEVITADTGEEGLEILKTGSIDLLVSDIKMPGKIDGFQLILRAKEIAADARVVIMTAFGAGRIESFADRVGITHYIEKPFNISELRDIILDLLDEREGFQGVLSDLELTDIIQMLCLAKRSTLLHLKHKDRRGKIVFEQGDVVHAEFGDTVGKEAVYEMLDLKQGDIFMESDYDYDQQTINIGWQDLLLEGVKLQDERRLSEESEGEEGNGGSPFASFRPEARIGSTTSESALIDVGMEYGTDSYAEEESEASDTDNAPPSLFSEEELEEISRAGEEAASDASMLESDPEESEDDGSEASDAQSSADHADDDAPPEDGLAGEMSQVDELAPSPEVDHSRQVGSSWVNDSTKRNYAPAANKDGESGEDQAEDASDVSNVDRKWSTQLENVGTDDLAEAIDSDASDAEDGDAEAQVRSESDDDPESLVPDAQDDEEVVESDVTAEGLGMQSLAGSGPAEESGESDVLEASEVSEVSEASEVSEVSEASEVSEVSEASEVSEVSEASEVSEVSEVSEASDVSEVSEASEIEEHDEPVQSLSESSSYATHSQPRDRRTPSLVAILEDFVSDCPGLRVTGIFEDEEREPLSFIEASGAGTHDAEAMSHSFSDLVDRAQRTVRALDDAESLVELQVVLDDAYAVVRRIAGTPYFQLATVDRESSLGVILVMMRQYGAKLSDALERRRSE